MQRKLTALHHPSEALQGNNIPTAMNYRQYILLQRSVRTPRKEGGTKLGDEKAYTLFNPFLGQRYTASMLRASLLADIDGKDP